MHCPCAMQGLPLQAALPCHIFPCVSSNAGPALEVHGAARLARVHIAFVASGLCADVPLAACSREQVQGDLRSDTLGQPQVPGRAASNLHGAGTAQRRRHWPHRLAGAGPCGLCGHRSAPPGGMLPQLAVCLLCTAQGQQQQVNICLKPPGPGLLPSNFQTRIAARRNLGSGRRGQRGPPGADAADLRHGGEVHALQAALPPGEQRLLVGTPRMIYATLQSPPRCSNCLSDSYANADTNAAWRSMDRVEPGGPYDVTNIMPTCYTCDAGCGDTPLADCIAHRRLIEPDNTLALHG